MEAKVSKISNTDAPTTDNKASDLNRTSGLDGLDQTAILNGKIAFIFSQTILQILTIHGGLKQEKYLKSCLDLGAIFFESTTPEVFKTTSREIADFRPSETLVQTNILEAKAHLW